MSIHLQPVPGLTANSAAGRLPLARIRGAAADGAGAGEGTSGWSFTFQDPFQLKTGETPGAFRGFGLFDEEAW